jgi:predicted membrane metal-binding protein
LTTGPLAWYYFKSFPTNFLLTNLIAIPLVGLIIPISILAIILQGTGICPELLVTAIEGLVTLLITSLETIAAI